MSKYLIGSKLLLLDNCRDEDWITLSEGSKKLRIHEKMIENFMKGKNYPGDSYKGRVLYQLSNGFYADSAEAPFPHFNILEHKENWIQCIKSRFAFYDIDTIAQLEILPKYFYHFIYQYYMIKENTHYISEEGKSIVQKVHDLEKPGYFIYIINDMIKEL